MTTKILRLINNYLNVNTLFFFRQKAKARVSETLSEPNAEQQVAPYGSMEYMPKAWMNFKVDKKAFYQALDSVLLTQ